MRTKLTIALGLLALGLITVAEAQVSVVDTAVTNSWAANATTSANLGNAVKVDKHSTVSVQTAFAGSAAGTDVVTINWKRSADNSTWETTPGLAITVPQNNTTAVVGWTNLSSAAIGGAAYLKISSIVTTDADAVMTNASVKVILKKGT